MEITTVKSASDLDRFINLPFDLYKSDPLWVPPLLDDIHGQFDVGKNPLLDHTDFQLFMCWDGKKPIGRIAAHIDQIAIKDWNEPVGFFGYYECLPEPEASTLLLNAARRWLTEKQMRFMRGPWSFVSQEWGTVVEGFTPPAVVMAPYNPAYYNDQFSTFGLSKIKDLLVYYIDAHEGYEIPSRILTLTDRISQRYGIHIRPIDMHHLDRDVEIINDLSNQSLKHNWGYSGVTPAEVRAMAHDLKPIIHPKAVLFAEDSYRNPIGFAIAIPDVNIILKDIKGKILPFGWMKLLWGLPRLKQYRMFALGVIPEYQGKGVDSLIYRALYESIFSPDLRMEINYVLEDNGPMNNAIIKLGAKPLRRYRIYQMGI